MASGVWEQALEDAAEELDAPATDFKVEKLATLTLLLKVQRSQWAQGKFTATMASRLHQSRSSYEPNVRTVIGQAKSALTGHFRKATPASRYRSHLHWQRKQHQHQPNRR